MSFIQIRFLDVLDIFLVAFLLYEIYILIKGTIAINIFLGIFIFYLIWLLVKALNMQLLGTILGQFMGVGVIALIVVFQQEVRKFLLLVGTRYSNNSRYSFQNIFSIFLKETNTPTIKVFSLVRACENMAKTFTGALIVIARKNGLQSYAETGEIIDANTGTRVIENIFFKNSPLHDGAIIVHNEKIYAARCVLPVSENPNISKRLGLRHRSAVGITEVTDAFVIVVSEERGSISYVQFGEITENVTPDQLMEVLENEFSPRMTKAEHNTL